MATVIELPKLYENMDEATIGVWQVRVGQTVKKGDFLVELITDKMVTEFESPQDGVMLAIYAQEKSTVPFGYALCAIGAAGESAPNMAAANEEKVSRHVSETVGGIAMTMPPPKQEPSAEKPGPAAYRVAPAAKLFARQQGIDLDEVAAFCKRDTIHRKDVEDYIDSRSVSVQEETTASEATVVVCTAEPSAAAAEQRVETSRRVALVTGATGGIGSAIARKLAADGAAIALHYHSCEEAAKALEAEIREAGVPCEIFQEDLSSQNGDPCKHLVDSVIERFGHVDILVNNAGVLEDATVAFMSDDQWEKTLTMDLTVPFKLIRAASMAMAHRHWGRIVSLSSDAGRMGAANRSNYAAAKEGLVGLTRSVARELAGLGIRANAVSPGFVETAMTATLSDKRRAELFREIPCRRFAKAEEVAALVAFLCSDAADYITGQVISINGGLCM